MPRAPQKPGKPISRLGASSARREAAPAVSPPVPPVPPPPKEARAGLEKLARFTPWAILAGVSLLYLFLMAQPINLITADLGRHLENGRVILSTFRIPSTNLYSYTFPDFPFVNHHWGSGVVFLLVHRLAGFLGLSLFFLAISLAGFLLFLRVGWEGSRLETAALASLPIVPILGTRTEVRPEAFSYLLCGVFLWVLWRFRSGRLGPRALIALPVLELVWVNLHIYFFLGPVVVGAFFVEEVVELLRARAGELTGGAVRRGADTEAQGREASRGGPVPDGVISALGRGGETGNPGPKVDRLARVKTLAVVLFATGAATLLNPFGLTGALYPLQIFHGYGHTILENQSVTSLKNIESFGGYPALFYFQLTLGLLVASWIWVLVRRDRFSLALLLLSAIVSVLGWTAIRNFGLFGYVALPTIAINLKDLWWRTGERNPSRAAQGRLIAAAALPLAFAAVAIAKPSYWTSLGPVGVGLLPGTLGGGKFWQSTALKGPIFNNYDIGGYLIYFLYPEERVFVDNRPEAYPATFFSDVYVPLQEDDARWQAAMRTYGFNSIVLHKRAGPRWLRLFLQKRIEDPAWAPVYVDDNAVIFVRREGPNRKVIDGYELCLAEDPRARWSGR